MTPKTNRKKSIYDFVSQKKTNRKAAVLTPCDRLKLLHVSVSLVSNIDHIIYYYDNNTYPFNIIHTFSTLRITDLFNILYTKLFYILIRRP